MRKTVAVLFTMVCMAFVAGCGGESTSSIITVIAVPTPVPPASAPGTILGGAIQGQTLAFNNYSVATFAGSSAGFSNRSTAFSPPAKFNRPLSVTTDGTNMYVADFFNNVIRQIEIATGIDKTLAGNSAGLAGSADTAPGASGLTASFNRPRAITTDGINLYVADSGNFTIRKIVLHPGAEEAMVTTLAGAAGAAGSIDADIGTNARFNILNGITTDGANLYVTDSNNTIRWIALPPAGTVPSGPVRTLAGAPGTSGFTDGGPAVARFNQPARITTDGPNLYVTDFGNNTIRRIDLKDGTVSTLAGKAAPGGDGVLPVDSTDGTGQTARFNQPTGITTDGFNLYVTDSFSNTIRQTVISSGNTTTIAGTAGVAGSTNAKGAAASFNTPIDITTNGTSLFIADTENHRIRQIQN